MKEVILKRPFSREPAQVQAEAKALEGAMAGAWTAIVDPDNCWCFQMEEKESGFRIHVSLNDAPKKYAASVSWPTDRNHAEHRPEDALTIGVGFQRGPAALADAIEKRLLPYVKQQWPLMLEKIAKTEANEDGAMAAVQEIAGLLHTKPSDNFKQTVYGKSGTPIHRIQVGHDGSRVTLDMGNCSVPIEFARKLIAFCEENYEDE